jgi:hypothetical protein
MSDFLETHTRLAAMHGYGSMEPPMPKSPQEQLADRIAEYVDNNLADAGEDLVGFIVGCLQGWTPPDRPSQMDQEIHQGA